MSPSPTHLLQTLPLEHIPSTHTLHIALYRNIQNASFLHQQLLGGNTDFEYAFIDASVVLSKLHILAAAYRAINDALEGRLKSRNIHSEIVFSLSMNNNIAESFRRFGITPSTTSLLVVKVAPASSAPQISEHLSSSIEGEAVPFEDETLSKMTDIARVKKLYKLNACGGGGGGKKGGANGVSEKIQDERKELEIMVLGAMALRGATN
ncbi:hypothetical protein SS1G_12090 [Sclerotinia sclerotiorum 1980 UF-70]|uniref:EKC/KEOPS complex subunit CGI121 n=2 Tax=Sclerotinia sclerotiorum (strain ATCC 18683 / 1980 / Ss-1) TaxID=665079 RepID=A7F2E3_SCLS1|nr:hypothetical protein SS1G_12090 [Sclerotinia sclerotiorum 1980 UF-70]APA09305.1 hypothetical protein sscle_05g040750 [Sclerotinia sclerotiorum 1980 UF-70]EDN95885.1 hypothetical protein SS1G_12090 [Sclerotinia sclerotiorum 1980 UF-70]